VTALYVAWAITALVLLIVAGILGHTVGRGPAGLLIDTRGRYSLTQLQIVLWTLVVVSLISGLFWARLVNGHISNPLDFTIPGELLAVLGISVGSTTAALAVKSYKNTTQPSTIAASDPAVDAPRFAQVFLEEQGPIADKVVDVAKFQNFWFTMLLVVGYVALVIHTGQSAASVATFTLPGFSTTFVTLLGISHAGYLAAKVPGGNDPSAGLNLAALHTSQRTGIAPEVAIPRFAPRVN
jgi:hypothetical protein